MHELAYIPSPTRSVWHLGPLPVRAYALCIVAGVLLAIWFTIQRWRARGGTSEEIWDIAGWAVLFGILGGRLYHVVSDPELYFEGKPGTSPVDALKIWDGGLGIWGAVALGTLGAWIGCRRKGVRLTAFADAAAPGVVIAQAIGRWGNYFNNELYGGRTDLPWKLQIHDLSITTGTSSRVIGYFQPTFLYESLWDVWLGVALLIVDRRRRLGRGNVMALYVMGYTVGRAWIEALRTDHANHILGLRLNDWTSLLVFLGALIWFVRHGGFRAAQEPIHITGRAPAGAGKMEGTPEEAATHAGRDHRSA
ncbi:MAG: prolipoprotein diacylglyceryl transferase [Jatrophihabitans sp.]|uniref:prolipoprotein diacylglyceryl transferase n=1 Tax=Jatrophihabitans sp. TaxID=1932789 RepID=UPI003F7CE50B